MSKKIKRIIATLLVLTNFSYMSVLGENIQEKSEENQQIVKIKDVDEYADAYQIYVAPDGNDNNAGTIAAPLKTFKGAVNKVGNLKSQDRFKNQRIVVNFMPGVYREDEYYARGFGGGGKKGAEVIYRAYEPGTVEFNGARLLDGTAFTAVTDEKIRERIQEQVRDKVLELDLTPYIRDTDKIDPAATHVSELETWGKLVLNNRRQQLAQWPNDGDVTIRLPNGERAFINESGKAVMKMFDDTMLRWGTAVDDARVRLVASWNGYTRTITNVDVENKQITLSDHGLTSTSETFEKVIRVTNILEELDIPGEFFIDVKTKKLYYYPPKDYNPQLDELELITKKTGESHISFGETSHIIFENINFVNHVAGGLRFSAIPGVVVDGCYFENCGSSAIFAIYGENNPGDGITIKNCVFNDIVSGIQVSETLNNEKRLSMNPSNVVIENNHIYNVSHETSTRRTGMDIRCNSPIVKNNTVHLTPNGALHIESPSSLVEKNEFYQALTTYVDAGVIYGGRRWDTYGSTIQYNYFHDYANYFAPWSSNWPKTAIYWDDGWSGTIQRYNIFQNNHSEKIHRTQGLFTNGGRDHAQVGNILVGQDEALGLGNGQSGYANYGEAPEGITKRDMAVLLHQGLDEIYYEARESNSPYYQKYGAFLDQLQYDCWTNNYYSASNIITVNNLFYGNNKNESGVYDKCIIGEENNFYVDDNKYTDKDIFVDPEKKDYRISDNGKKILGITEDTFFPLDESFDYKSVGYQGSLEPGEEFKQLWPISGDTTPDGKNTVTICWERPKFADEFEYKVYKKETNELVDEGKTFKTAATLRTLEANTEYYWTVKAKILSWREPAEWDAVEIDSTFKTGDFEALEKKNVRENTVIFKMEEDYAIVDGEKYMLNEPMRARYNDKDYYQIQQKHFSGTSVVPLIPVKPILEKLGGSISIDEIKKEEVYGWLGEFITYEPEVMQITLKLNDKEIKLIDVNGSGYTSVISVNGEERTIVAVPYYINDELLVPSQVINSMGLNVLTELGEVLVVSEDIESCHQIDFNEAKQMFEK